jgi:hypothetical protein
VRLISVGLTTADCQGELGGLPLGGKDSGENRVFDPPARKGETLICSSLLTLLLLPPS